VVHSGDGDHPVDGKAGQDVSWPAERALRYPEKRPRAEKIAPVAKTFTYLLA
jgi:hypothetical protein